MFLTLFILVPVFGLITFILWHGVANKLGRRCCKSNKRLDGKTAVITGASAGIGKETARDFASRGARVVLACRNIKKAQNVADSIIASTGNENVVVYELDTSDLGSVRSCAKEILSKENRLDILVNNAGTGGLSNRIVTKDNLDLTMATNYFGHFLFTNLLLGLMMKSGSGRIANVSSQLHRLRFSLDPKNLNFESSWFYTEFATYPQSKLCLNLFSFELAKRLKNKKSGVTVNALHPGIIKTEIFSKLKMWLTNLMEKGSDVFGNSVEIGAQTIIQVSVSEEVDGISGKYFDNCQQSDPSSLSENDTLAKQVWEATVKNVGLKSSEMFV